MRPALSAALLIACFGVAGYQDMLEAQRQQDEAKARLARYQLHAQPEVAQNTGSARPVTTPVVAISAGARVVDTTTPAQVRQHLRRGATL